MTLQLLYKVDSYYEKNKPTEEHLSDLEDRIMKTTQSQQQIYFK